MIITAVSLAAFLTSGINAAAGSRFQQTPGGGFTATQTAVAYGPGQVIVSGEGLKTSTKSSQSSGFLGFGKSKTEETKTKFGNDVLKEQKTTQGSGKVEIKRWFNNVAIPSEGLVTVDESKRVLIGGKEIDRKTGKLK